MSILNDPSALVSRWKLQGDGSDSMGRYPGTVSNAAGWPASFFKNSLSCLELNGNDTNVNCGDITQLNAVSAFTLAFWMNQDVIAAVDIVFIKRVDAENEIQLLTAGGPMIIKVANGADGYGQFDYSTVVAAGMWHHMAMVFDGSQTGNANRLIFYVDGAPQTWTFIAAPIPATTADMAGNDAYWGYTSTALDGRLFDGRLYNRALSRDQIGTIIHEPAALV